MKVPPGLGTGPGNRGNPPYERVRHYFFDMGNDSLLAFFEIPKGKEPPGNRNAIGAMQHCAFVVTAERFREVEAVYYHSSQPWPFPANIMLGFHARARTSAITIDYGELQDARWFERNWLLSHVDNDSFRLPRLDSIARRLIEGWLHGHIEIGREH